MKILPTFFSEIASKSKILFISLFVFVSLSCDKDDSIVVLDFDIQIVESFYYPDEHVTGTFNILSEGGVEPCSIKWFNPELSAWENQFNILVDSTLILDFEISDAAKNSQRFTYSLSNDSISALAKDFRYQYIGTYDCQLNDIQQDTLKVTIADHEFHHIYIWKFNKFQGAWREYGMRYNQGTSFYGYHSGVSFTKDSIFYTEHGSLGNYYTLVYKGRKMEP